ncbi:MAG TPA: hypothetical protein VK509_04870, partial [Polyangiales bacterium]|nr:hypothetical protein [Polyangiales bacterium]
EPCEKPAGGSAACNEGRCEPTCPAQQRPCAGTCIDDDAVCSALCPGATHDCSGVCIANGSVNGCGASSCAPCPAPAANGHPTCDGATCDIACDDGYERCANDCIREADCCAAQDCGGTGWSCSSGHQCECASDHRSCKGGCIERSRCCDAADCASNQACQDGACVATNWCALRARPGGVAATDYRCLDFEAGLPPSSEWTRQVVSAGTLELSTASASSLPSSVRAGVDAESSGASADRATLSFSAVGGSSITSASVAVDINPSSSPSFANPWTGGVDILCVSNSVNELCLGYTISQDIVGFFLSQSYSGGIAFFDQCAISTAIPANNWTRVELRVSTTSAVSILVGGVAAATGSCTMRIDAEASLSVAIGLRSNPITAAGWSVNLDNAEAIIRR